MLFWMPALRLPWANGNFVILQKVIPPRLKARNVVGLTLFSEIPFGKRGWTHSVAGIRSILIPDNFTNLESRALLPWTLTTWNWQVTRHLLWPWWMGIMYAWVNDHSLQNLELAFNLSESFLSLLAILSSISIIKMISYLLFAVSIWIFAMCIGHIIRIAIEVIKVWCPWTSKLSIGCMNMIPPTWSFFPIV